MALFSIHSSLFIFLIFALLPGVFFHVDEFNKASLFRHWEFPLIQDWSEWSEWSVCSRTCKSGVQYQVRRCLGRQCPGKSVKHRLCQITPCPFETPNFRQLQCSAFDSHLYRGRVLDQWLSMGVENREPCALLCRSGKHGYVAKLAPKVTDGTSCSSIRSAVCVDGKCLTIGCDGILDSGLKLDKCGFCGGRNHFCNRPLTFSWKSTRKFSYCGPENWRVSVAACVDQFTNQVVPDQFCAHRHRPRPTIEKCSSVIYPAKSPELHLVSEPRWLVGTWEDCNSTCGGGSQWRMVYCAERRNISKGTIENIKVDDRHCWQTKRPITEQPCAIHQCPIWESAEWSSCSVTCNKGVKTRKVVCKQERYKSLRRLACDPKIKPSARIMCYTGVSCDETDLDRLADYDHYRYVVSAPFTHWNDEAGGEAVEDWNSDGFRDGRGGEPSFLPGSWGSCSTTCGSGVRVRKVDCVVFQRLTGGVIRLPNYECDDSPKPSTFQPCRLRSCPLSESNGIDLFDDSMTNQDDRFRWSYGNWTECSASCLGGKQKSTLLCVHMFKKNSSVAWSYCDPKQRPIDIVRRCNNRPCPPSWETGPLSVCSHSCGGGLRSRKVRCTRRIGKGGGAESTLILPDGQCLSQKPVDKQPCGMADCPVEWKFEPWNSCSTTCGPGDQNRAFVCQQLTALGKLRIFTVNSIECQSLKRPTSVRKCNLGTCSTEKSAKNFVQNSGPNRRLRLKIGGKALLFEGTSIKIKCPVHNFDQQQIVWTKDGDIIKPNNRMRISKYGALRIFKAKMNDVGVYSCIAGTVPQGNVTLAFKLHRKSDPIETVDDSRQKKLLYQLLHYGNMELYDALKTANSSDLLKTKWTLGEWSACPVNCDQNEGQIRQVQCKLTIGVKTAYVNDRICASKEKPAISRKCLSHCPEWKTGAWSMCDRSARCVRFSTALQRRTVFCTNGNGTLIRTEKCDRRTRPKIKKECFNDNCTAEWRTSPWAPCSRTCSLDQGVQMRVIRCVWRGTRKAAGRNCDTSQRPVLLRHCRRVPFAPTCPPSTSLSSSFIDQPFRDSPHCMDESRFCDVVKLFHSCHRDDYRRKCCLTCNLYN